MFLRFQEYYESPEFSGKAFTLDEFKNWYSPNGRFTYYSDWDGFNIPSWVLDPFKEGKLDPLAQDELDFISLFGGRDGKFYIIGTHGQEPDALNHEIAHGLYYVEPAYKEQVLKAVSGLKETSRKAIFDFLAEDYAESSLEDELHAYLLDSLEILASRRICGKDIKSVSKAINDIYLKFTEGKLVT